MAFSLTEWSKGSSGQMIPNSPQWWSYKSSGDTLATITASAYFNDREGFLNVNDLIWVVGSDDQEWVRVTSATAPITVETITGELDSLSDGDIFVGNGSNVPVGVTMSGDATIVNTGALTIGAGAVSEAKIAPNALSGTVVGNVADQNAIGGIPVLFRVTTAGGASANIDVVMTHDVVVIDAWVVNKALGTASDTVTVQNSATAITDAMDINKADKIITRAGELDDGFATIAATGTLRIAQVDGGGNDSPACDVYVLAYRTT